MMLVVSCQVELKSPLFTFAVSRKAPKNTLNLKADWLQQQTTTSGCTPISKQHNYEATSGDENNLTQLQTHLLKLQPKN